MARRVQVRGRKDCATNKDAKSTKGWVNPSSGQARRRKLAKRCPRAFMVKTKDGRLKFPVMPEKGNKRCCIDCRGARVGYSYASRFEDKYPGLAPRIRARAKHAGCEWAQKPAPVKKKRRKAKSSSRAKGKVKRSAAPKKLGPVRVISYRGTKVKMRMPYGYTARTRIPGDTHTGRQKCSNRQIRDAINTAGAGIYRGDCARGRKGYDVLMRCDLGIGVGKRGGVSVNNYIDGRASIKEFRQRCRPR